MHLAAMPVQLKILIDVQNMLMWLAGFAYKLYIGHLVVSPTHPLSSCVDEGVDVLLLPVCCRLVTITFLQHTHPNLPHYEDEEWDWIRGALATVDRR